MRVDRRLLALIAVVAVLALFIDGFAYIYRVATGQPLTGPIRGIPTLNIGFLGFSQQIYVHKGLDLQGGTHLELEITNVRSGTPVREARDIAVQIVERRVNSSGYAESVVRPEGDNRILVELPGVNLEQAKQILGKTSYLTIWEWVPGTPDAKTLQELNPTDANKYQGFKPQFTQIDGSMITSASRSTDPNTNLPDVQFSFNNTGNDRFCNLPGDRAGHLQDFRGHAHPRGPGGFHPLGRDGRRRQCADLRARQGGVARGSDSGRLDGSRGASRLAGNPGLEYLDIDHLLRPLLLRRATDQRLCDYAGDRGAGQYVLGDCHHPAVPAGPGRAAAGAPARALRRPGAEGRMR